MTIGKITNRIIFRLLLVMTCYSFSFTVFAQPFTPGESTFDSTGYVEYISGNLPVVISVPHGGYLEPAEIPDRDCDSYTCIRDAYTQELGRSIGATFFAQTGCHPHMVINLLHRKKFDANREILEAADGNATVEKSWQGYHAFIESAKTQIVQDYGRGLFLDLHGHGHEIQRIELGYRISRNELQLPDTNMDAALYVEKSSIQTLVGDNLLSLSHSQLLRGAQSFGSLLENKQIPAVPSTPIPFPLDNESYFSGGYNTDRHGSVNGGSIDGIQIECHQDIRFDTDIREMFADSLTAVINEFIGAHYHEQYENNYCNLITAVPTSTIENGLKIFPNPAVDYFQIDSDRNNIEISIYNCLGQKVGSEIWQGQPISIGMLQSGYYIVEMRKGKRTLGVERLIKQ